MWRAGASDLSIAMRAAVFVLSRVSSERAQRLVQSSVPTGSVTTTTTIDGGASSRKAHARLERVPRPDNGFIKFRRQWPPRAVLSGSMALGRRRQVAAESG